jgi:hypothetical protein
MTEVKVKVTVPELSIHIETKEDGSPMVSAEKCITYT